MASSLNRYERLMESFHMTNAISACIRDTPVPTEAAMEAQLRNLRQRHPVLAMRIIDGTTFSPADGPIPLQIVRAADDEDPEAAGHRVVREMTMAGIDTSATLVAVRLVVPHADGGPFHVVVAAAHAVTDTHAMYTLVTDIVRGLLGLPVESPGLTGLTDWFDQLPPVATTEYDMTPKDMVKERVMPTDLQLGLTDGLGGDGYYEPVRRRLEPDVAAAFLANVRAHRPGGAGVWSTIQAVTSMAETRLAVERTGAALPAALRVGVVVDSRRMLKLPKRFVGTPLSIVTPPEYAVGPGTQVWALAEKLGAFVRAAEPEMRERLRAMSINPYIALDQGWSVIVHPYGSFDEYLGADAMHVLGPVGFLTNHVLLDPPPMHTRTVVLVIGSGGGLDIVHTFVRRHFRAETIHRMADLVNAAMQRIAEGENVCFDDIGAIQQ